MKRFATLLLALALTGCAAKNPVNAPAPGYTSTQDQTLGQNLAGLNSFVAQEKLNYAALSPDKQAVEKPYLNTLIDSLNVADALYVSYHRGQATLQQVQTAYSTADAAKTSLMAKKGVQ